MALLAAVPEWVGVRSRAAGQASANGYGAGLALLGSQQERLGKALALLGSQRERLDEALMLL